MIDVRLVPLRDGRWVARVEGRRVPRSEADRPSTCLAALARLLDTTARTRAEAEEASTPTSSLFANTETGARAADVLRSIRGPA